MSLISFFSLSICLSLLQAQGNSNLHTQSTAIQYSAIDYVGTWVAHTSKGDFKLILSERKNVRMINGKNYDAIVGRHFYLNNSNESLSKPEDKFVLFGIPSVSSTNELPMTFTDEVNDRTAQIKLSFVGSDMQRLHWKLTQVNERVTVNSTKKMLPGISVPTDITLDRVR